MVNAMLDEQTQKLKHFTRQANGYRVKKQLKDGVCEMEEEFLANFVHIN